MGLALLCVRELTECVGPQDQFELIMLARYQAELAEPSGAIGIHVDGAATADVVGNPALSVHF